jgi:hypothetical protein
MNEEELARIVGKHESPGAGIYAQGRATRMRITRLCRLSPRSVSAGGPRTIQRMDLRCARTVGRTWPLLIHAGEDTYATRASRIGKLMTAAAAARAMSAYHIH